MKSYLLAVGLVLLLCPATAQSQVNDFSTKTNNQNSIDKDWLQKAERFVTDLEYEFKKADQSSFKFYTANRKQKIGFTFSNSGYTVSPIKFTDNIVSNEWKTNFQFVKLSRGNAALRLGDQYTSTLNKANLRFQFPGIDIEYINNADGLRQNFIVSKKLTGNDDLELLLKVSGDLVASVNNNEVILKDKNGVNQLFYRDLNVWDADH